MKLYELREEYNALLAAIESGETDIPEEALRDTLEAIDGEIRDKAVSIAVLIKDIEADVVAFKTEEERLSARRKQLEKKAEWLKSYVATELGKAQIDNIRNDPRAVITFRKSKSVEITDETAFLTWAQEYRPAWIVAKFVPNKTSIRGELESGAECPYARYTEKTNIQIK